MTDKSQQSPRDKQSSGKDSEIKPLEQVLQKKPVEIGGPAGLEPTRYGDWERKGRCIDF